MPGAAEGQARRMASREALVWSTLLTDRSGLCVSMLTGPLSPALSSVRSIWS